MPFYSWSPTRLADYEACPAMANWKHLVKLCPLCFKGRLAGGFDGIPVVCDTCNKTPSKPPALERGTRIGEAMEAYLKGTAQVMPLEIVSDVVRELVAKTRKQVLQKKAKVERMIILNSDWEPVSTGGWLYAKTDVTIYKTLLKAHVIDWKTGGVDKRTKAPYDNPKYDDQLSIYTTAALSENPVLRSATAALVFLDAENSPIVERETASLTRGDKLRAEQKRWTERVLPMMKDDVFAPSPSTRCRWCPYSNSKGGPCQF